MVTDSQVHPLLLSLVNTHTHTLLETRLMNSSTVPNSLLETVCCRVTAIVMWFCCHLKAESHNYAYIFKGLDRNGSVT